METTNTRKRFDKLLALLISFALAISLLPAFSLVRTAYADDETTVLDSGTKWGIDWVLDSDYTLTISPASDEDAESNGCSPGEITYTAFSSTNIPWYSYTSSILKIVVESGITTVYSLRNCTALTEVELADTVTTVGNYCFYNDTSLSSLDFLPDSVTTIENYAFYNSGLKSLDGLPDSVASVGTKVFYNCKSMSYLKYPDAVAARIVDIGDSDFGTLAEGAVIDLSNMYNLAMVGSTIATGSTSPTIILPEAELLTAVPGDVGGSATDVTIVIPSTVRKVSGSSNFYDGSDTDAYTAVTLRYGGLIEASEDADELLAAAESAVGEIGGKLMQSYYDFGGVRAQGNLDQAYSMTTVTMDFEGTADEAPEVYYLASADSELVQVDESQLAYDEDISAWRLSVAGAEDGYATGLYVSAAEPSVADATIELSATAAAYTGSALVPEVTVTYDGTVLVEGTDYTLSYADNVNVGTATVTVTGTGGYAGTATATFEVTAAEFVSAELSQTSYDYDGKAKFPSATVVDTAGATLAEGTDYELLYSAGCTEPGAYKVTVLGLGTYDGQTLEASFTIVEAEAAVDTDSADYQAGYAAGQAAVASTAAEKATQELGVAVAAKSVKVKKLKTKKRTVKALTVTGAKGKVTYAKVAKGSSKKLTVNSKTGKITVKKGTKKGTYKVKVRVKAASTGKYAASSTVVTVKVKVVK